MEKDYNAKLKYSKETVDEQIKEACRGILKEKDDEINKLGIKVSWIFRYIQIYDSACLGRDVKIILILGLNVYLLFQKLLKRFVLISFQIKGLAANKFLFEII